MALTKNNLALLSVICAVTIPLQANAADSSVKEIVTYIGRKMERAEATARASGTAPSPAAQHTPAIPQPASTAWENFAVSRTEPDNMRADAPTESTSSIQ